MLKEIFNFYSNLYSDGGLDRPGIEGINWALVDTSKARWLKRPFNECEVQQAMFECKRDKALGSNGFSMAMFQDCFGGVLRNTQRRFFLNFLRNELLILASMFLLFV